MPQINGSRDIIWDNFMPQSNESLYKLVNIFRNSFAMVRNAKFKIPAILDDGKRTTIGIVAQPILLTDPQILKQTDQNCDL